MEQMTTFLLDTAENIQQKLFDTGDLDQASPHEMESILKDIIDLIKGYEKNTKELDHHFGDDLKSIMRDMKYAAVAIHKAMPAYNFIDENCGWMGDDLERYCDDLIKLLDK